MDGKMVFGIFIIELSWGLMLHKGWSYHLYLAGWNVPSDALCQVAMVCFK